MQDPQQAKSTGSRMGNKVPVQVWMPPEMVQQLRNIADREHEGNLALTIRVVLRSFIERRAEKVAA